jgi:hypothetical protein
MNKRREEKFQCHHILHQYLRILIRLSNLEERNDLERTLIRQPHESPSGISLLGVRLAGANFVSCAECFLLASAYDLHHHLRCGLHALRCQHQ